MTRVSSTKKKSTKKAPSNPVLNPPRRGRGRPRLEEGERRQLVALRVTGHELDAIRAAATASGLGLSAFARFHLVAASRRVLRGAR